jgi:hypothetical protein
MVWRLRSLAYAQIGHSANLAKPGTLYDISGAMEMIYKMKKAGVIKYE